MDVVDDDVVVVGDVVHTSGGGSSTGCRTTLVATPVCTSKMPPVVCEASKNTIGSAALPPTTDPRFCVVPVNRYCPAPTTLPELVKPTPSTNAVDDWVNVAAPLLSRSPAPRSMIPAFVTAAFEMSPELS